MNKKNFKDNTANIDRFFSEAETQNTQSAYDAYDTLNTDNTQETQERPYRINLKLRTNYRQYLDDEAWKARISITEYLNRLIQADMDKKNGDAKDTTNN